MIDEESGISDLDFIRVYKKVKSYSKEQLKKLIHGKIILSTVFDKCKKETCKGTLKTSPRRIGMNCKIQMIFFCLLAFLIFSSIFILLFLRRNVAGMWNLVSHLVKSMKMLIINIFIIKNSVCITSFKAIWILSFELVFLMSYEINTATSF